MLRSLVFLVGLTVFAVSCTDDTNIDGRTLSQKLAQNEDYIQMVNINKQIEKHILEGTIQFPEDVQPLTVTEGMTQEDAFNAMKTDDFKGFDLYKELSMLKFKHLVSVTSSFTELEEMNEEEMAQTLLKAAQIINKNPTIESQQIHN